MTPWTFQVTLGQFHPQVAPWAVELFSDAASPSRGFLSPHQVRDKAPGWAQPLQSPDVPPGDTQDTASCPQCHQFGAAQPSLALWPFPASGREGFGEHTTRGRMKFGRRSVLCCSLSLRCEWGLEQFWISRGKICARREKSQLWPCAASRDVYSREGRAPSEQMFRNSDNLWRVAGGAAKTHSQE